MDIKAAMASYFGVPLSRDSADGRRTMDAWEVALLRARLDAGVGPDGLAALGRGGASVNAQQGGVDTDAGPAGTGKAGFTVAATVGAPREGAGAGVGVQGGLAAPARCGGGSGSVDAPAEEAHMLDEEELLDGVLNAWEIEVRVAARVGTCALSA
eukprot:351733-Chlamydomonas_euryale.AAC.4